MNELSKYDVCMVSTRLLLSKLEDHSDADHTENWTNGWLDHFPCWVWLANTGRLREASNNGVLGVRLHVANQQKWLVVASSNGNYQIDFDRRGGIQVMKL